MTNSPKSYIGLDPAFTALCGYGGRESDCRQYFCLITT
jgi:hypothetical protein